jgi:hypothetical protein
MLVLGDDIEGLRFVQAWAVRHDDPARQAHALERLAAGEADPSERRDLFMERGKLLRSRLSDPKTAIVAFEATLALEPQFWPALEELALAAEQAADHPRLAAALERQLQDDEKDPLSLLRRLSDLYEGPLADDANAIKALARWANLDSESAEPLRRLRKKHLGANEPEALLVTLDALFEREADPTAKLEATVAAAELAYRQLADSVGAIARLAPHIAKRDPDLDRALFAIAEESGRSEQLHELLSDAGRHADLVEHLERAALRSQDPEQKTKFLRRAARTLHEQLNDAERASQAYAQLLELQEDAEALRFMQARALEADDPARLADVLLRLSKIESDTQEQRDLLFEYAHLQNYRLDGRARAIVVLRRILDELDPEFEPALDELINAAEGAPDAVALAYALSRALDRETDPSRRAELAEKLAGLYQEVLKDPAQAQRTLQLWAAAEPNNLAPLRRLRRLLEQAGEHAAQLVCLDRIASLSNSREERNEAALAAARLYRGPLADENAAFARLSALMQNGVAQAEDALHELAWQSGRLEALGELYERSGRFDDLCALLRARAEAESDPTARAELHLRCARLLSETIGDEVAAADAYREALALREEPEALRYLRRVAERQDDTETLEPMLARLAASAEPAERASLSFKRALLLRDRLGQSQAASQILQTILAEPELDAELRSRTITELTATAEKIPDLPALALALEARLRVLHEPSVRRDVALRLADLYEGELAQPDAAADALREACAADANHLHARRRYKLQLARREAWPEYIVVLDALAQLEPTQAERRAARLAAARTSHEKLQDAAGALTRLGPLIIQADAEAESLALALARPAGLGRELANLYILRTRGTSSAVDAQHSWRAIMQIHEEWLEQPSEAFEAALRLLAADPLNRSYLDDVDRLAVRMQASSRLAQVYAKLVRAAPLENQRIELSSRAARLLANNEPGLALDFALQAARIAPSDVALLARVEQLAEQHGSHTDLFWSQEQRALVAATSEAAIDAWVAAARSADLLLHDREQANACLRRALTRSEHGGAQAIEAAATALDLARPELGEYDARRALLRAHLELAEQAPESFRSALVLRAARFAREVLHDEASGFDVLRSGAAWPPFNDALLDALEAAALRINRLDALDAQLARSAERSESEPDRRRLLARRARILTDHLSRFDQAAQVYDRLLELAPRDAQTAEHLLRCLRKAGRHRELLRACERRLLHTPDPELKLPLMREMATIWEVELKNRASALAIWHDVRAIAPRDEEAALALERLSAASSG